MSHGRVHLRYGLFVRVKHLELTGRVIEKGAQGLWKILLETGESDWFKRSEVYIISNLQNWPSRMKRNG